MATEKEVLELKNVLLHQVMEKRLAEEKKRLVDIFREY